MKVSGLAEFDRRRSAHQGFRSRFCRFGFGLDRPIGGDPSPPLFFICSCRSSLPALRDPAGADSAPPSTPERTMQVQSFASRQPDISASSPRGNRNIREHGMRSAAFRETLEKEKTNEQPHAPGRSAAGGSVILPAICVLEAGAANRSRQYALCMACPALSPAASSRCGPRRRLQSDRALWRAGLSGVVAPRRNPMTMMATAQ